MLNFPTEYQEFIEKYGVFSKNGVEIYGLKDGMSDDAIPSVIAATKLYSKNYDIKENEFVIAFDDYENCPIILTADNKIYKITDNNQREKIADSFNEWFNQN